MMVEHLLAVIARMTRQRCVRPFGSVMTRFAVRPQRPRMECRLVMARYTGGRKSLVLPVGMALRTSRLLMLPRQREAGRVMVEVHIAPTRRRMARFTSLPILSIVLVIAGMAGITILRRTLIGPVHMAGGTVHLGVLAHQRESRGVVIEVHVAPSRRHMACRTVRTILPIMLVFSGMAGVAVLGRAFEDPVHMAGGAVHRLMGAVQREGGGIVVEVHLVPFRRPVTDLTSRSELSIVMVVFGMAGIAVLGRALIHSVHMAGLAVHGGVRSCQREGGGVVIEGRILPFRRGMARPACRSELTLVPVIFGMAGVTLLRGALEGPVHMAGRTGRSRVRTHQRESRNAMVEVHIAPAGRLMARFTRRPELTVVMVVFRVAGIAVLRRPPEDPVGMAGFTRGRRMRTHQRETGPTMVEDDIAPAGRRMARRAFLPETSLMHIVFSVAGKAARPDRCEDAVHMTLGAVGLSMSADQCKPGAGMVKVRHLPVVGGMALAALLTELALVWVLVAVT